MGGRSPPPPTQQCAPPARRQGMGTEDNTPIRRRAPPVCVQETGEGGHTLSRNARSSRRTCRRGRGRGIGRGRGGHSLNRKGRERHPPNINV